ncbi:MAG: serine hydrolase [Hyphomicrobiales bacterium]|nr:serine hydrolase [Hyphomicrobiales bacterium]
MLSRIVAALCCSLALAPASARERCPDAFPAAADIRALGWSADGLAELKRAAQEIGSAALLVVTNAQLVLEHGDAARPLPVRSIRKSLLGAMIGQAAEEGLMSLDAPLSSFSGVDLSELTDDEKKARLRDLLASRSGVYLPAAAETADAAASRPARGSHPPGSHWHYNNWDFNAAGTIFEAQTGETVFAAFERRIAAPLCMQDYQAEAGAYSFLRNFWGVKQSPFPAYHFKMSARDLTRFGELHLRKGVWGGRQIVPEGWVAESTRAISPTPEPIFNHYGYMWWVAGAQDDASRRRLGLTAGLPAGSFAAAGYGGQWLIVIPAWDTVIAHLTDTGGLLGGDVLSADEKIRLFNGIVAARVGS